MPGPAQRADAGRAPLDDLVDAVGEGRLAQFPPAAGLQVQRPGDGHRRRRRAERGAAYYDERLARVEGRRTSALDPGLDLAPESHPYAHHLDLFGEGSLFQLLCGARTAAGEATLARWLCSAAEPREVRARQAAIRELREDVVAVLSSGWNEEDATSQFLGAGLAGFLQKPYTPEQLAAEFQT